MTCATQKILDNWLQGFKLLIYFEKRFLNFVYASRFLNSGYSSASSNSFSYRVKLSDSSFSFKVWSGIF